MNITLANYTQAQYDVFEKFHRQLAVLSVGSVWDFRCMTIGGGAMGNLWGHPGSALTVYVNPKHYTFDYMDNKDFFTVSFFPEKYRSDVITLGTKSGRDEDKVALTGLTPRAVEHSVAFEQAELTFVCKKIYADFFRLKKIPEEIRNGIYSKSEPPWFFIGSIVDVFGEISKGVGQD